MTQERRSDCLAHASLEATLGSMNEKIDLILERQLEYSNRITKLETIVTNGLSHNVANISKSRKAYNDIRIINSRPENRMAEKRNNCWLAKKH
jgi:translation initiation factor 2B subunit (eIF-2B alpha/beta/delta family)